MNNLYELIDKLHDHISAAAELSEELYADYCYDQYVPTMPEAEDLVALMRKARTIVNQAYKGLP